MLDVETMLKVGQSAVFNKDDIVFLENEQGQTMYVVLKGNFGVYINTFAGFPKRLATVEQGSFFGEMSVIDGWTRSATIIADEDECVVLVVEKDKFRLMLEEAPEIAEEMLETLKNRVINTTAEVRKIGKDVPEMLPGLTNVKYKDPDQGVTIMEEFALRLRMINALLAGEPALTAEEPPAEPQAEESAPGAAPIAAETTPYEPPKAEPAITEAAKPVPDAAVEKDDEEEEETGVINLLPEGYESLPTRVSTRNKFVLRTQPIICPHCGWNMEAQIPIFSALQPKQETMDGRITYHNLNILLYTNVICERCAYTDVYQEFTKSRMPDYPNYKGEYFENAQGFESYKEESAHTTDEAVMSYYQNIACIKRTTKDPHRLAKAWIRLYWLYSDAESGDFAKDAAQNAYKYYKKYLSKNGSSLMPKDLIRLNAVLAELALAQGDKATAAAYYEKLEQFDTALDEEFLAKCRARLEEIA